MKLFNYNFTYRNRVYSLTDIHYMEIFANVNKNPKLKIVTKSGETLLIEATNDKQKSDFSKQELPSTKGSMIIYTHNQEPEVFINKLHEYLSQQIEELKKESFNLENILHD